MLRLPCEKYVFSCFFSRGNAKRRIMQKDRNETITTICLTLTKTNPTLVITYTLNYINIFYTFVYTYAHKRIECRIHCNYKKNKNKYFQFGDTLKKYSAFLPKKKQKEKRINKREMIRHVSLQVYL